MASSKAERVLRLLAIVWLILVMSPAHFRLLWKSLALAKRVKIDSEWSGFPLSVVVVTPTGAELLLSPEELDDYRHKHADYSFLIPGGREKVVEGQIVSSRCKKCPGCKGQPSLSVIPIDPDHQLIELYIHGDPHDDVFWYEASDKQIVPQYWVILGISDAFLILMLVMVLITCEYFMAKRLTSIAVHLLEEPPSFIPSL